MMVVVNLRTSTVLLYILWCVVVLYMVLQYEVATVLYVQYYFDEVVAVRPQRPATPSTRVLQ